MRKLLIAVAAVVVVLAVAVLVVPSLIDWNGYKPEIQAAVKDATGRDLRIGGDIGLRVLPSPSLSVENVAFANAEGGSTPDMASLESLRVNVALMPLLTGDVRVTSVTLIKPTVVLERLPDGRANWELAASGTDGAPAGTQGGGETGGGQAGGGRAFSLDAAEIEDGTIVYRDAASGAEHRIENLDATVAMGSLQGPFDADGTFVYQGLPMTLDASVGRLNGGRSTPVKIAIAAAERALNATLAGSLDMAGGAAGPKFQGEASAEAPDLGRAVERLTTALGQPGTPYGLGQPMSLTSKVEASPGAVSLSELALAIGESRLQGKIAIALADEPTIDAALTGNRFNLDELIPAATAEQPAGGGTPAPAGDGGAAADGGVALPTGIGGSVDLAIDAVQYKGAAIRQVRLAGDLVDGSANLRLATAQLPGGTEVTLTGTATSDAGEPHFVGRVEAVSDNLRGTLEWAGIDTSQVAADRLRKASLRAAVDATPKQVKVSDWTMELDATNARGGLTLAVRERPAFGLSLQVDRINLDAYMPVAAGGTPAAGPAQGGQPAPAAGGSGDPLSFLTAVDANVNIKVGEATVFDVPVRDARVDALLQNGTLTLRDVGVADLGGARATVAGVLRNAAGRPSVDMTFDVSVTNVDRFAKLLSAESPIPAKQLGQVSLKGSAAGDMQDVKVDATLTAAGGSFGVKGTAKPLAAPPGLDLALSLAHPDANKLIAVLAPGALAGAGPLGALEGDGTITTRDDGRYAVKLGIRAAGGSLGLVGNADVMAATPDLNLATEINHPDAVRLFRTLSPSYRPAGSNLGPFKFGTAIKGPVDNISLTDTEVLLGAIRATGQGTIDRRGEKPAVTLALAVNKVEVDPWLPPSAPKPQGAVPAAPVPAGPAAPSREWSRERIDLSALSALDADITAKVESIVYGSYVVDNADLVAKLKDGQFDLSKLDGGMFGGTFALTARVADRPVPTAGLTVKVRDADVRQAARSAAGTDAVSGILTYDTQLSTEGASEFELVSALAGTGSFNVRDGVVQGIDLKAFSDQLKELNRAPDFVQLAQRALSGGETAFSSLAGTYTVTNGVLRSDDIALQAEAATGAATAVVNLPPQQMDVRAEFRLSEHPNSPPVGVQLVGPLDNPRRIFKMDEMQAYIVQRLVERGVLKQFDKGGKVQELLKGLGGGSSSNTPDAAPTPQAPQTGDAPPAPSAEQAPSQPAPSEPAPSQQEPAKPEEAVRDLLKGLLQKN